MRNGTDEHARWADDLAAYALGSLDANEAPALERHLAACPRCQAELHSLREAVDTVPSGINQIKPPRRLRRQLMRAVGAEARARPTKRPPVFLVGGRAVRTAGVLGLAIGAGAIGYVIAGPGGTNETSIPVQASAAAGNAGGQVIRTEGVATLRVRRMPQLQHGDVYELWIQAGQRVRPSTLFVVDRHGDGSAVVQGTLAGADHLMVTREPPGGSRRPTSSPLLRASLD